MNKHKYSRGFAIEAIVLGFALLGLGSFLASKEEKEVVPAQQPSESMTVPAGDSAEIINNEIKIEESIVPTEFEAAAEISTEIR